MLVFQADRDLDCRGVQLQFVTELLDDVERVRSLPVQFVDERKAWHIVALHLPVDSDGLRLHPADTAQHQDGAVQHAKSALYFHCEVNMAGCVDDVDVAVPPRAIPVDDNAVSMAQPYPAANGNGKRARRHI